MKEKIQLLARGIINEERPEIIVSESPIEMEVDRQGRFQGFFVLSSADGQVIRAMLFSSSRWLRMETSSFIGSEGRIAYTVDAESFETGETVDGSITIVSNGGEVTVPVCVHICTPYVETSMGRISDLDLFADLARDNWNEALAIFTSPDFPRVFLNNERHRRIYESLSGGSQPGRAMEEFLCAMKRKSPVRIRVAERMIELEMPSEETGRQLLIERDQWGHTLIKVSLEGSCVDVIKKQVTEDDFLGSYYTLEYHIRPVPGRTAGGAIILDTYDQHLVIPVLLRRERMLNEQQLRRRDLRVFQRDLHRSILDFETGKISRSACLTAVEEAISGCCNNSDEKIYKAAEAAYMLVCGDREEAAAILREINGRELRYESVLHYCFYLFVDARCKADEHYTQYVTDTLRFYAEGQYSDNFWPFFLLTELTGQFEKAVRSQSLAQRIYEQLKLFAAGPGPVPALLYLTGTRLINAMPSMLRELGSFEQHLLVWAARHDCLEKEAVFQAAEAGMRLRVYSPACLEAFGRLYKVDQSRELLTALLRQMVLGKKTGPDCLPLYQAGVEASLKLPGIYEAYMQSLDRRDAKALPMNVLLYYQYDNRLEDSLKAWLYRYVISHEELPEKMQAAYVPIIHAFTVDQLQKGSISGDLAALYRHDLALGEVTPHDAAVLPEVLFKQEIRLQKAPCRVSRVLVDYAELEGELSYPIVDGLAYVDIFLDDYRIIFEDEAGARYMSTIPYTMTPLIDASEYVRTCFEVNRRHYMLVLNRSERAMKYQMMDDTSIEVYKNALKLDKVSRRYKKTILRNLIDYYYDSYEGETLEKYLLQIDIQLLDHEERCRIIEYFIQRGLYEKARDAIVRYGFEGIQDKRIMRLCSRLIRESFYEEDELLTEMAYRAFSEGKYDEATLAYLVRYYTGPTGQMYRIWQAARDFEVPAGDLEERFLQEILFAEVMLKEGCELFASYYSGQPKPRLVRAFLVYAAWQYMLGRAELTQKVFQIMEIEMGQLEEGRRLLSIALIRNYSENRTIKPGYYAWLYREIAQWLDEGVCIPAFSSFAGCAEVPVDMTQVRIVSCRVPRDHTVTITFSLSETGEPEQREKMAHIFGGVFVKAFRLFKDETLRYTITDDADPGRILAEGALSGSDGAAAEGSQALVDGLLDRTAFHDEQAAAAAILEDAQWQAVTDRLFKLQ